MLVISAAAGVPQTRTPPGSSIGSSTAVSCPTALPAAFLQQGYTAQHQARFQTRRYQYIISTQALPGKPASAAPRAGDIADAASRPHDTTCLVAAACVSAMLLCCQPAQAAATPPQLVLLDSGSSGNAAIMSQLKQLQQSKQKFGTQDPGSALAARFMGAQQQLQRIELLVKIQQFDNARMQLREGSFKTLRSDLRYESEYRGVQPELTRSIIEGVEKLDRQLRGQEPKDTIVTGVQQLQQQLQQLVDQAQPLL